VAYVRKKNTHRSWWGKSAGKRSLGRSRRRWADDIKVDTKDVGWTELVWLRIGTNGRLL
jgi:hypothetical protein